MELKDRIRRLKYIKELDQIVCADIEGRIYLMDLDLNILNTSKISKVRNPMGLAIGNKYIFTKSPLGDLAIFDKKTLDLLEEISGEEIKDEKELEEEERVYSASKFCYFNNGILYYVNGYGQLIELDEESRQIQRIIDPAKDSHLDGMEVNNPFLDILSDLSGNIRIGSLEKGIFNNVIQTNLGPIHCVRYDEVHERFWFSTDDGFQVGLLDKNGKDYETFPLGRDDLEWIEFNNDQSEAYISSFDHHIYVVSNIKKPRIKRILGPFKYQVITSVVDKDDNLYTLLQSGEIIKFNKYGQQIKQVFNGNAIWDMVPSVKDKSRVYCAMEDGSINIISYKAGKFNDIIINEEKHLQFNFGRVKHVRSLKNDNFVGLTHSGWIFNSDNEGNLNWYVQVKGNGRFLDISPCGEKILVTTDYGYVAIFNLEGEILQDKTYDTPVWASAFGANNNILVGLRKHTLYLYNDNFNLLKEIKVSSLIKRMQRLDNENILISGGNGVTEVNTSSGEIVKEFIGGTINTVENTTVIKDYMFCISYSSQIASYEYDTAEIIGYSTEMPDYPKALTSYEDEDGNALLLVGGRTPYVRAYRVDDEGLSHFIRQRNLNNNCRINHSLNSMKDKEFSRN